MKTHDMIQNLSNEPKPDQPHFYRSSFLIWSLGTTALLALFFYLIPTRADLSLKLASTSFQTETLLLFILFFVSTWLAYRSAIPGLLGQQEQLIGVALIAVFGAFVLSKLSISGLANELHMEMDFYRGRCGPILLILAGLQTIVGMFVARRAAPTNLYRTGAWLGVSAGAMALVTVQLFCDHENFLHVVIWHALPATFLVGTGALLGRRFLRW